MTKMVTQGVLTINIPTGMFLERYDESLFGTVAKINAKCYPVRLEGITMRLPDGSTIRLAPVLAKVTIDGDVIPELDDNTFRIFSVETPLANASDIKVDSTPITSSCTCSLADLMARGCTCGRMQREKQ